MERIYPLEQLLGQWMMIDLEPLTKMVTLLPVNIQGLVTSMLRLIQSNLKEFQLRLLNLPI